MNEVFMPVESKLNRVLIQISELESSIHDFSSRNLISVDCILNEGRLGYKLVQRSMPDNIPINDWDIRFGECIHNLRSSLDNFAFALARLENDPPTRPEKICFPVFTEKEKFINLGLRSIEQLPSKASELIEKLQPFNRDGTEQFGKPEDDPLVILTDLNNSDKHRIPSVALITPTNIGQEICVEFYTEEDASANIPPNAIVWVGPLKAGTVLFEYKTTAPIETVKGKYKLEAAVGILYKGRYLQITPLLKQLYNYLNLVFSQFHDFF